MALDTHLSIYLSVYISIYLYIHLSIYPSIYPSIYLSILGHRPKERLRDALRALRAHTQRARRGDRRHPAPQEV